MRQNPPFQITPKILSLVSQIQEIVGGFRGQSIAAPSIKLRKENKIKTVHHSLAIEGNGLNEKQVTDILNGKRVIGSQKQIREVKNALKIYEVIRTLRATQEKDFLKAHGILMAELLEHPGRYRQRQVGILKGEKVAHVAPPAKQVPKLMADLFFFLQQGKEIPWLVKACVFHYEVEFIHPFEDGNGRMGRLWQQVLLMNQSSIFEYVPIETLIHKHQKEYYRVLEACDKKGDSTAFIEFGLENIRRALVDFDDLFRPRRATTSERLQLAMETFGKRPFSRADYRSIHKDISTATASRDLASAVRSGILKKSGDKNKAIYRAI